MMCFNFKLLKFTTAPVPVLIIKNKEPYSGTCQFSILSNKLMGTSLYIYIYIYITFYKYNPQCCVIELFRGSCVFADGTKPSCQLWDFIL